MNTMRVFVTFLLFILIPTAYAKFDIMGHDHDLWAGSFVQMGLTLNTGNTKTKNLDLKTELHYKEGNWQNKIYGSAVFGEADGKSNKKIFNIGDQLNYTFSKYSFTFMKLDALFDKFSPYKYTFSESFGYGRTLIDTKNTILKIQAGPGLRQSRERATNDTIQNGIFTTALDFHTHLSPTVTFDQTLEGEFALIGSDKFNLYKSKSSVSSHLSDHLALSVGIDVVSYSKIPSSSSHDKKTDTHTSASISYTV